jgi:hypothetical protein
VKEKASGRRPAKDLYLSPLFLGRKAFVEASCDEWWILSAKHHLVRPDRPLKSYNQTLKTASRAERREWASAVLAAIDAEIRPRAGDVFEIHLGAEYRDFGLVVDGCIRGCRVENPTAGLGIGQQLRFYQQAREGRR